MNISSVFRSIASGFQAIGSFIRNMFSHIFSRSSYQGLSETSKPLVGRASTSFDCASTSATAQAASRVFTSPATNEITTIPPVQSSAGIRGFELTHDEIRHDFEALTRQIANHSLFINEKEIKEFTDAALIQARTIEVTNLSPEHLNRSSRLTQTIETKLATSITQGQKSKFLADIKECKEELARSKSELNKSQSTFKTLSQKCQKLADEYKEDALKFSKANNPTMVKIAARNFIIQTTLSKKNKALEASCARIIQSIQASIEKLHSLERQILKAKVA